MAGPLPPSPASDPSGYHLLAEYFGCDPLRLDRPDVLERALVMAAEASGSHVLGSLVHKFQPQGVTCVLIVAESHLSVHTWPERAYAAADFFTCGGIPSPRVLEILREELDARSLTHMMITRGVRLSVTADAS